MTVSFCCAALCESVEYGFVICWTNRDGCGGGGDGHGNSDGEGGSNGGGCMHERVLPSPPLPSPIGDICNTKSTTAIVQVGTSPDDYTHLHEVSYVRNFVEVIVDLTARLHVLCFL